MLKGACFALCVLNLIATLGVIVYIHDRLAGDTIYKDEVYTNNLKAGRVFISDNESNGYIELIVDKNGPLMVVSHPNGVRATAGAVPVKKGLGTGRTTYPAFAVSKLDGELFWIAPFSPDDDEALQREALTGTAAQRLDRWVDQTGALRFEDSGSNPEPNK